MKKRFSKTTYSLIAVAFIFLGSVVLYWFLYDEYQETLVRVDSLRKELVVQNEKKVELDLIGNNLAETFESYEKLDAIFVDDIAVVDFIQEIEKLGTSIGLEIETSSVDAESVSDLLQYGKEKLSISVKTVGGWSDTIRFIGLVENLPYKISFSELSIRSNEIGDWEAAIGFNVIKKIAEDENQ